MTIAAARLRPLRVTLRLSIPEHAQLVAAADSASLTLSAYIRHGLTHMRPPRASKRSLAMRVALARILSELGRIGELLREILRAMHAVPSASGPVFVVERDLSRALGNLTAAQKELLHALGRKARPA